MLVGKSTQVVDGVGQYTGMTIVTTNTKQLKRSTEKDAWRSGQKNAMGMINYFKKKAAQGDTTADERLMKTIAVVQGYVQYTQVDPLSDVHDDPAISKAIEELKAVEAAKAAEAAEWEALSDSAMMRELERVAMPMQMDSYTKKVILNDDQFKHYMTEFRKIDKDNSGYIEKTEIVSLLSQHLGGRDPTPEQTEEVFGNMDANKDGLISLEEWIGAVIGKDYAVSNEAAQSFATENPDMSILDMDGHPLCVGLIYMFKGGG